MSTTEMTSAAHAASNVARIDPAAVDGDVLAAFMGQAVVDIATSLAAPLLLIGERLGLFRAMAGAGPMTSAEVASRAGVSERYTREWLRGQAAGGYVRYDASADRYTLPDEHALALAVEDSPYYVLGVYSSVASIYADLERLTECFRTGQGFPWGEHEPGLFVGTERFFRPGYSANLVPQWLPALDGVVAKLEVGARVADIGCGHGASTLLMARAFPNSEFRGFDLHEGSITQARRRAAEQGVTSGCTFDVASADDFPGSGYDLVTHFDCLHDMGDPIGAARHVREVMADDGTWMIVEPMAADTVAENLNPVGRCFYNASTVLCTPASLSQEGGMALGAQAGEAVLTDVIRQGGFTRVRRAAETPFNLILEARP
ncbi:MAG TPA: class I SAM-dependent methyltransferase [Propionibacteriaceae bacterium]